MVKQPQIGIITLNLLLVFGILSEEKLFQDLQYFTSMFWISHCSITLLRISQLSPIFNLDQITFFLHKELMIVLS